MADEWFEGLDGLTDAELERRKLEAEVVSEEINAQKQAIILDNLEREREHHTSRLYNNGVFVFFNEVKTVTVRDMMRDLEEFSFRRPGDPITLYLNSPGGSVYDGLALYDAIIELRALGHHVTTHARGMAASMGSVLLQAGDERFLSVNASVLVHKPSKLAWDDLDRLVDAVDQTKVLAERLKQIYLQRATITEAQLDRKSVV